MTEGGMDVIDGLEPDRSDMVVWKAWANEYLFVQWILEMSLGTLRGSIVNNPKYQVDRWHPIMARYYIIEGLLSDSAILSSVSRSRYDVLVLIRQASSSPAYTALSASSPDYVGDSLVSQVDRLSLFHT